uniref:Epstein-Barr virus EBNA-1-like n=1 Tax=Oryza sativa subsp. japonica TaxID=39947 RepID=Q6Z321_ORYSJ|nr:Epstein-Barr virus EBNA-1-like [Oryza sativa Japonica Group]BAD17309.1 Epstein-Barr virus EBNA-1-like [Oryza sativa Japonica Group]
MSVWEPTCAVKGASWRSAVAAKAATGRMTPARRKKGKRRGRKGGLPLCRFGKKEERLTAAATGRSATTARARGLQREARWMEWRGSGTRAGSRGQAAARLQAAGQRDRAAQTRRDTGGNHASARANERGERQRGSGEGRLGSTRAAHAHARGQSGEAQGAALALSRAKRERGALGAATRARARGAGRSGGREGERERERAGGERGKGQGRGEDGPRENRPIDPGGGKMDFCRGI